MAGSLSRLACTRSFLTSVAVSSLSLATLLAPRLAEACGCFSPPIPETLTADSFAINQKAERIIFEVNRDAGTVSAHVSIAYSGDPQSFAWLVPVPNIEEVGLSHARLFQDVDAATSPRVSTLTEDLCPEPAWECTHKDDPCNDRRDSGDDEDDSAGDQPPNYIPNPQADLLDPQEPVNVVFSEIVGDYEVIVFEAEEAELTVEWLKDNGFIVNETMTPYMQPYLDDGMMFLAAKLVPGAGIDSIKPLKMTYRGEYPMIPLRLTAVAADPHMPVIAYIFASEPYAPKGHKVIEIGEEHISQASGRSNYPAVMNRLIDEATTPEKGAFVAEYSGTIPNLQLNTDSLCCGPNDSCGIADDTLCQCPSSDWDVDDCGPSGILEVIDTYNAIQTQHSTVTRLVTRLSPDEMTYDPVFEPASQQRVKTSGVLTLTGLDYTLDECANDVADQGVFDETDGLRNCSDVYCGSGECVVGADELAACDCDKGFVAQKYTELDSTLAVRYNAQA